VADNGRSFTSNAARRGYIRWRVHAGRNKSKRLREFLLRLFFNLLAHTLINVELCRTGWHHSLCGRRLRMRLPKFSKIYGWLILEGNRGCSCLRRRLRG
jgi:hypothetical protein